jgi:hypothetical protein
LFLQVSVRSEPWTVEDAAPATGLGVGVGHNSVQLVSLQDTVNERLFETQNYAYVFYRVALGV